MARVRNSFLMVLVILCTSVAWVQGEPLTTTIIRNVEVKRLTATSDHTGEFSGEFTVLSPMNGKTLTEFEVDTNLTRLSITWEIKKGQKTISLTNLWHRAIAKYVEYRVDIPMEFGINTIKFTGRGGPKNSMINLKFFFVERTSGSNPQYRCPLFLKNGQKFVTQIYIPSYLRSGVQFLTFQMREDARRVTLWYQSAMMLEEYMIWQEEVNKNEINSLNETIVYDPDNDGVVKISAYCRSDADVNGEIIWRAFE